MALYAGETVEVTNAATDFDGATPITPTILGAGSMRIVIVDAATPPNTIVGSSNMAYDSVRALWFYMWATPGVAGTYLAKVTATGADGSLAFNFLKIRLKAASF
jgi:hypothetical protein